MDNLNLHLYSPLQAPKIWFRINSFCLIWSFLLIIEILFTLKPLDRLEGTHAYLTYNFGTTLIWLVEIGLTIYERHYYYYLSGELVDESFSSILRNIVNDDDEHYFTTTRIITCCSFYDIPTKLELVLAIIFCINSAKLLLEVWQTPDSDVDAELFDTIMSFVAYLYIIVKFETTKIESHNNNEQKQEADDDDHGGYTRITKEAEVV